MTVGNKINLASILLQKAAYLDCFNGVEEIFVATAVACRAVPSFQVENTTMYVYFTYYIILLLLILIRLRTALG